MDHMVVHVATCNYPYIGYIKVNSDVKNIRKENNDFKKPIFSKNFDFKLN